MVAERAVSYPLAKHALPSPSEARAQWAARNPTPPWLDVPSLSRLLDHDSHAMRAELRAFLAHPLFDPARARGIPLDAERELALQRLQLLCPPGVPGGQFLSVLDFKKDPRRVFAAHELVGLADGSLATKMTVQWNLAGGTILKLGTKRHHDEFLAKMDGLERIGCFALTELGYGNNAVAMETTAIYDQATSEFVINTPTAAAQKYDLCLICGVLSCPICILPYIMTLYHDALCPYTMMHFVLTDIFQMSSALNQILDYKRCLPRALCCCLCATCRVW
jgi:hypothetical protein